MPPWPGACSGSPPPMPRPRAPGGRGATPTDQTDMTSTFPQRPLIEISPNVENKIVSGQLTHRHLDSSPPRHAYLNDVQLLVESLELRAADRYGYINSSAG